MSDAVLGTSEVAGSSAGTVKGAEVSVEFDIFAKGLFSDTDLSVGIEARGSWPRSWVEEEGVEGRTSASAAGVRSGRRKKGLCIVDGFVLVAEA